VPLVRRTDDHDAVAIVEPQIPCERSIHNRVHRRVRSNSQRQRKHCCRRESGALYGHPQPEPEIAPQVIKPAYDERLPALLLAFLHSSKLNPRLPLGLFPGHTRMPQILRSLPNVRANLVVHLPFDTRTPE